MMSLPLENATGKSRCQPARPVLSPSFPRFLDGILYHSGGSGESWVITHVGVVMTAILAQKGGRLQDSRGCCPSAVYRDWMRPKMAPLTPRGAAGPRRHLNTLFAFVSSLPRPQAQAMCFHKGMMKRTLGKATCAYDARDYVVSDAVAIDRRPALPFTDGADLGGGNLSL